MFNRFIHSTSTEGDWGGAYVAVESVRIEGAEGAPPFGGVDFPPDPPIAFAKSPDVFTRTFFSVLLLEFGRFTIL